MRPTLPAPIATLAAVLILPAVALTAMLEPPTVSAWNAYVATTEARIGRELASPPGLLTTDFSTRGNTIAVPDGLISHWRGSVFLAGAALDPLLTRLQHPSPSGPHQEDVLALRVLERKPDELRLFIRMSRTKIVTVTYDTEHRVEYHRRDRSRAWSRSVATRIVEIDRAGTPEERARPQGDDRGFLWRLNSYWRYEQVQSGVIVDLESLTLSRDVPFGLRTVVEPIIEHVARESMGRTLDSFRNTYAVATRFE